MVLSNELDLLEREAQGTSCFMLELLAMWSEMLPFNSKGIVL